MERKVDMLHEPDDPQDQPSKADFEAWRPGMKWGQVNDQLTLTVNRCDKCGVMYYDSHPACMNDLVKGPTG